MRIDTPTSKSWKQLRPDYLVIKHCSDNEDGDLGVDYSAHEALKNKLREAEALSDQEYKCIVKWSKINANGAEAINSAMVPHLYCKCLEVDWCSLWYVI